LFGFTKIEAMKANDKQIRHSYQRVKNIGLLLLLLILFIGCKGRDNKVSGNTGSLPEPIVQSVTNHNRENIPFDYDESGTSYSGAFTISSDYFAELTLNIKTGQLIVLINGDETPCELSMPEDPEVFLTALCITTEDLNEDGYMDFILTPNCSARFPVSYVHLFDKNKECFVAHKDDHKDEEPLYRPAVGNTIGFITFDHEDIDAENKITFLNDDGSVWMEFGADDYHYDKEIKWAGDFHPWALESEYKVFVIRCTGKDDKGYRVIIDEEHGTEKQMPKHRNIKLTTTEEHMLNYFIGYDRTNNPLRETPDGTIIQPEETEDILSAVEVKGDWIKIKDVDSNEILGWIKWRDKDVFLIDFYYSM